MKLTDLEAIEWWANNEMNRSFQRNTKATEEYDVGYFSGRAYAFEDLLDFIAYLKKTHLLEEMKEDECSGKSPQ